MTTTTTTATAKARHAAVKALFTAVVGLDEHDAQPLLARALSDGTDPAVVDEVRSLLGFHIVADIVAPRRMPVVVARDPADPLALVGRTLRFDRNGAGNDVVVVEFVAEGGFGVVYRGVVLGLSVAIKVLRPQASTLQADVLRAAFVREGVVLDGLGDSAPAIRRGLGVGVVVVAAEIDAGEVPFLVLEWLEGTSLGTVVRASQQQWPLARVVELLAPVAAALSVAHAAGIAHRDLKPDNLFVEDTATGPRLRLFDFGVAKVVGGLDGRQAERGFLSTTGQFSAATTRYAAPEQLLGTTTGPWTDVWSFALVVVELLCGELRTGEHDPAGILARVRADARPPTPRAVGVEVSDAVEAAFSAALSFSTSSRPSIAAFFAALR